MGAWIVLLRGVNLGPHRRVAMADVRRALEDAGFSAVRSLLQSGNLVVETEGEGEAVESAVEAALLRSFGLATEAIARTPVAWRAIIDSNPFPGEAREDPGRLVVVVMKCSPSADAEARVDAIEGPERARVIGREAFIHYPAGQADTKVSGARLDKALGARGTARNWNTVLKLAKLAGA